MGRDIRQCSLYKEAYEIAATVRRPGANLISDAADLHASPDGSQAIYAGTIVQELRGPLTTRICTTDIATGDTRVLTAGPGSDRSPKFSPDGQVAAFLSNRVPAAGFQLYLLDLRSGATTDTPRVDGWIEYLSWSPHGGRILLGVAGHGADVAGASGAVTSPQAGTFEQWMPQVSCGSEAYHGRRTWVYDLNGKVCAPAGPEDLNVWEAVWIGNDSIVAIASSGSDEASWYTASLHRFSLAGETSVELYKPKEQLGCLSASADGRRIAIVEARCSDRGMVAGDVRIVDAESGGVVEADLGIDATHTEWITDELLLVAGHRNLDSVVVLYDHAARRVTQLWESPDIGGPRYLTVSGAGAPGDFALVGEGFLLPPEIAHVKAGAYRSIRSFDLTNGVAVPKEASVRHIEWQADDGLRIQGRIILPTGKGPFSTIMYVHGGPVNNWRPHWLGRTPLVPLLINKGYAIFYPNPRGSIGRGQDFLKMVYGDMGGGDAGDLLAGLDTLVEAGLAEPTRLGVMGGSYGGFMTSWLVTQVKRFSAAVPLFPHTNQVTCRLIGNIPAFFDQLLDDDYTRIGGEYYLRSPINFAREVSTPVLNVCGSLDRCTPPEEALQFHNAITELGGESVLLVYPDEGHGVKQYPAVIDLAARIAAWFQSHMPAQ